jgi:hypothetical protein
MTISRMIEYGTVRTSRDKWEEEVLDAQGKRGVTT